LQPRGVATIAQMTIACSRHEDRVMPVIPYRGREGSKSTSRHSSAATSAHDDARYDSHEARSAYAPALGRNKNGGNKNGNRNRKPHGPRASE
jgi:hypothetical protein